MSRLLTEEEVIAKSKRNREARQSVRRIGADYFSVAEQLAVTEKPKPKTIKEKKVAANRANKSKVVCLTEHQEQCKVIEWADKHPIAGLIFAIPNGSHKSPAMAAKFKREGLRSGVPDLFLPVPRKALWNGLFVEMKRVKGSITSEAQYHWHEALLSMGYQVKVCRGADDAIKVIQEYLGDM